MGVGWDPDRALTAIELRVAQAGLFTPEYDGDRVVQWQFRDLGRRIARRECWPADMPFACRRAINGGTIGKRLVQCFVYDGSAENVVRAGGPRRRCC